MKDWHFYHKQVPPQSGYYHVKVLDYPLFKVAGEIIGPESLTDEVCRYLIDYDGSIEPEDYSGAGFYKMIPVAIDDGIWWKEVRIDDNLIAFWKPTDKFNLSFEEKEIIYERFRLDLD